MNKKRNLNANLPKSRHGGINFKLATPGVVSSFKYQILHHIYGVSVDVKGDIFRLFGVEGVVAELFSQVQHFMSAVE